MKLQVAIDLCDTESMLLLVKQIYDVTDIIEIGTPMIVLEGQKAVKALRKDYPNVTILSDTKIMDGGSLDTKYACDAGADIVTVLAVAHDETIRGAIETAHSCGKEILVDMINSQNFAKRAKEIDDMRADYIGVHTASDVQASGQNPIDEMKTAKEVVCNAKVAVAGGIGLDSLEAVIKMRPDVIIAGSKITGSQDPRETILAFKRIMSE